MNSDETPNIISSETFTAQALIGQEVGSHTHVSPEQGEVGVKLIEITPLPELILAWVGDTAAGRAIWA